MKVLKSLSIASFYIFMIVVIVSCTNNRDITKETQQIVKTQNKEVKLLEDEKAPLCYSKSEIDLLDSTTQHILLRKISAIKEVQNFSYQNNNMISYCLTETKDDDIYQSNSYRIQVALETEDHYSIRFNFYSSKLTKEIKILEVLSDSFMSIEKWRNVH